MKTLKFNDNEVKLSFESYRNNGTLAVEMITVPDEDLYAVITHDRQERLDGRAPARVSPPT